MDSFKESKYFTMARMVKGICKSLPKDLLTSEDIGGHNSAFKDAHEFLPKAKI